MLGLHMSIWYNVPSSMQLQWLHREYRTCLRNQASFKLTEPTAFHSVSSRDSSCRQSLSMFGRFKAQRSKMLTNILCSSPLRRIRSSCLRLQHPKLAMNVCNGRVLLVRKHGKHDAAYVVIAGVQCATSECGCRGIGSNCSWHVQVCQNFMEFQAGKVAKADCACLQVAPCAIPFHLQGQGCEVSLASYPVFMKCLD